jgi:N-acetylmuramoyl-L-alanine amidase
VTRLALIPGHGWRARTGGVVWDPGAVGVCGQEAGIVRVLAGAIAVAAVGDRARSFDSAPDGPGTYTERRTRAHAWIAGGPSRQGAVVHLHCNASTSPTPAYSMVMHDPRSKAGAVAASVIRHALGIAGVPDVRVVAADRGAGWAHAANLVEPTWDAPSGVYAVLIELGFVSAPASAPIYTPEALAKVARAITAASL